MNVSFSLFFPDPSNNSWLFLPSPALTLFLNLSFDPWVWKVPSCDTELVFPERGNAELSVVTSNPWVSQEAAGRVPQFLAPSILGSSLAAAQKGTGSGENNGPQRVRPPPSRPGTDSDNHPFCNKQETSLPASEIEQTKTPKFEALTVGQLRFLTLLPDSLQCMFFVFCF